MGNERSMTVRRERIVRVAAELFAEKGYHATGVKELCAATGLGRGALYHYIESKEDLLYEITSRYISELVQEATSVAESALTAREKVSALSRQLLDKIGDHLSELTVCFAESRYLTGERHDRLMSFHHEYERLWLRALRQGVATGEFRAADPVLVKGILGMHFYSYLWLASAGKRGPDDIASIFDDLMVHGLRGKG